MILVHDLRKNHPRFWQSHRGPFQAQPGQIIMKFGSQLRSSVIKEYQWHYLDYDELKQMIKKGKGWTEEDEAEFIKRLDEELEKVAIFKSVKSEELMRTIQIIDKDVHNIVARLDDQDPISSQESHHGQPAPTEEEFMALEEDLSVAVADVHDLDKFVSLNYTGFNKIVKKHDVRNPLCLKFGGPVLIFAETNFLAP